jgi:hypothetical protein
MRRRPLLRAPIGVGRTVDGDLAWSRAALTKAYPPLYARPHGVPAGIMRNPEVRRLDARQCCKLRHTFAGKQPRRMTKNPV